MKILIKKNKLPAAPEMILRQAGYKYLPGRGDRQDSFVREIRRGAYPRFHVYLSQKDDLVEFNLHLDQKKPSYSGVRAHSGEYDGEVVEMEIKRLKAMIVKLLGLR